MYRFGLVVLGAVGCTFSGGSAPDTDTSPDSGPALDANLGVDGATEPTCTAWPMPALQFNNCEVAAPMATPTFEPGVSVLDTDTGVLTAPSTTETTFAVIEITQAVGPTIALLFFESLDIPAGTTIRAEGDRPLLLASDDVLRVAGTIDVGSYGDQSGLAAGVSFTDHCLGDRDADGNSGAGGGGGFGTAGGTGGSGNGEANTGGDGGGLVTLVTALLPGCAGGIGHDRAGDDRPMSSGGVGGGVVELAARTRIDLANTALIAAGGMGGGASDGNGSGGGGGGSGGLIGLDSVTINIGATVMLLAHGGGGGEGSGTNNDGVSGEDSPMAMQIAQGGAGGSGSGGDGGDGGFDTNGPQDGLDSNSNGGGAGGGGLGILRCASCQSAFATVRHSRQPTPTPMLVTP